MYLNDTVVFILHEEFLKQSVFFLQMCFHVCNFQHDSIQKNSFNPTSDGVENLIIWQLRRVVSRTEVINFSSMLATRLKQWVANKSDMLLCHIAHISDIIHAN